MNFNVLNRLFCLLIFAGILVSSVGCGGNNALTLYHYVDRPPVFKMDSIRVISIGAVNDDGKRLAQNEIMRALLFEKFVGNKYYVIHDARAEKSPASNTVELVLTVLNSDYELKIDTITRSYPTKKKDKRGRTIDSIVKTPTYNAKVDFSVSCRLVNTSNGTIMAVRTFNDYVKKDLNGSTTISNSVKRGMEKEAAENIVRDIRNWLLPYTDIIALTLHEDEENNILNYSNDLIKKNDYANASKFLKENADTMKTDNPNLHKLWYNLGCLYLVMNRYEDCKLSFEKALSRNPSNRMYTAKIDLIVKLISEKKELEKKKIVP